MVKAVQGKQLVRVSLVVITLNEEKNIAACIRSVGDFADEVLVCDMYSKDRTREIAEKLGARVLCKRERHVEGARPFAAEQACGEWVFFLDADERATTELLAELRTLISLKNIEMIRLRWAFLFMGKLLQRGAYGVTAAPRVVRRSSYLETAKRNVGIASMHTDQQISALRSIPNQVIARARLIHLAYPTLEKYARKTLHQYSIHEARERYELDGKRPSLWRLIYRPTRAFVASFFYRLGFLDGIQGFIASVVWAHYGFLSEAHLYDLEAGRTDDDPWVGIVAMPKGYDVGIESALSSPAQQED